MSNKNDKNAGRKELGIPESDILAAIVDCKGIVSKVADALGCAWKTAEANILKHDSCVQAMEDERQRVLDFCESKVLKAINLDDISTAKWYLSKKGKDRGYGDDPAVQNNINISDAVLSAEKAAEILRIARGE